MSHLAHCAAVLGVSLGFVCAGASGQPVFLFEEEVVESLRAGGNHEAESGPENQEEKAEPENPAQDAESPESVAGQFSQEIVVTARRVHESVQDVPASVSVYTAADLASLDISGFDDLRIRVPSLQYYDFNIGLPHFFVRGIGSVNRSGASDPAVGVFVDDVYIARGFGVSSDLFDMERIEVLRGPQGTFFGRNAVGGAIALHTRQPTDSFDASVSVKAGNNRRFDLGVVLNAPFGDRAFGRLTVLSKNYEGNAFNITTGHHLEGEDHLAIRGSVKLIPKQNLVLLLSADKTRDEGRGNWWHLGAEGPFSIGNSNPDPRSGRNPIDGTKNRDDWGASTRMDWTTPLGALTSITAYRRHEYEALDNTTGLFVAELTDPDRFKFHHTLFIQGQEQTSRVFTQEARWSSRQDGRVSWLGGIYYLKEAIERVPTTQYRFIFFDSEGEFGHEARNQVESYAAFGQAEYSFQNGVSIAAGLRFTRDRKDHRSSTVGQHFTGFSDQGEFVSGWSVKTADAWAELTPMMSVRYQTSQDVSLYGTVSKGFKSGGFNDEGAEKAMVATPFKPETAWNYEIGVKCDLRDRRGRVNASVFFLDYSDLQVEQFIQPDPALPPLEITANAGESIIQGVELEWAARLLGGLWLYGSYAHLDTEIRGIELNGVDISGNQLAYAPEDKFYLGVEHARRGGWQSTITLRAGFSYEDEFFGDIGNSDVIVLDSRKLLDAGVSWASAGAFWTVSVWGKNLTNQLYAVTATEVPVSDRYEKLGAPRLYGVTVAYRF